MATTSEHPDTPVSGGQGTARSSSRGSAPSAGEAARDAGSERRLNRLAAEKSPYLLQHADNPVDWYPWGEEAFEAAREKDRPLFVSIGYSTCHWCHVMEHESFANEEIAALMNDTFVCVKVDREERPDIDHVFMQACRLMSPSCGWPLNAVLTPEGRPFFVATYLPPTRRFSRIGMRELVPRINELWTSRREQLLETAAEVTAGLEKIGDSTPGEELDESVLQSAHEELAARYDRDSGGFGAAPKFPTPHSLLFLLRRWKRTGDPGPRDMVTHTLVSMRRGGIYDHLGFGFHRYSTDAQWRLPHFEKMLYDQALLAAAYTEAHLASGDDNLAQTALEIVSYLDRDMTSADGAFYSAEDADSDGEEGRYYLWSEQELGEALGDEDAALARRVWSTQPEGNYREESTGQKTGLNVLHVTEPLETIATDLGLSRGELVATVERMRQSLLEHRETRTRPQRDDKTLTDWNGLTIAALAKASRAFGRPDLAQRAARAVEFLLTRLRAADGRLLHRFRDGAASIAATADDYAFLVWGLVELHQATFDRHYLDVALGLQRDMLEHYWDQVDGGFFLTPHDGEGLLVRPKVAFDGAVPSANSVAMLNLARLARLTGETDLEQRASEIGRAFGATVAHSPASFSQMMVAVDYGVGPSQEVVIVGKRGEEDTGAMLDAAAAAYLPNAVLLFHESGQKPALGSHIADLVSSPAAASGRATAFVCSGFACDRPTTSVAEMMQSLGTSGPRSPAD